MKGNTIKKYRLRRGLKFEDWGILITGTLALLGIMAFFIWFLLQGGLFGIVLSAVGLAYALWSTYDTFVTHACWTLYLEETE
ncbi:membrane protein [Arthrobacter phage Atuin]|nr:membrane protein [Arthrobacter phage Atuin]